LSADSWKKAAALWWAFTWRWPLLFLVPFVPLAIVLGAARAAGMVHPSTVVAVASWVTWPFLAWAQIAAMRQILSKWEDYK
jgi:hypothetical protein